MEKAKSYRNLEVWVKSKELAVEIYKMTSFFPKMSIFLFQTSLREQLYQYLQILQKVSKDME